MLHTFAGHISAVLMDGGFDPGQGEAPPGSDKIQTVIKWVAWIVFALGVAGLLIVAGRMMIKHKRGEGEEAASGLVWVVGGCIIAASAGAIVAALA